MLPAMRVAPTMVVLAIVAPLLMLPFPRHAIVKQARGGPGDGEVGASRCYSFKKCSITGTATGGFCTGSSSVSVPGGRPPIVVFWAC